MQFMEKAAEIGGCSILCDIGKGLPTVYKQIFQPSKDNGKFQSIWRLLRLLR
jgi:hypothetical protein